jgi:hypothetical protein
MPRMHLSMHPDLSWARASEGGESSSEKLGPHLGFSLAGAHGEDRPSASLLKSPAHPRLFETTPQLRQPGTGGRKAAVVVALSSNPREFEHPSFAVKQPALLCISGVRIHVLFVSH